MTGAGRVEVAQVCNLLYRRFEIGRLFELRWPTDLKSAIQQNIIPRYFGGRAAAA